MSVGADLAPPQTTGQEAALAAPSPLWNGDVGERLDHLVQHEAQLVAMGATPQQATVVSAELDWGTLTTDHERSFSRSGLTVREQRLSDSQMLAYSSAMDQTGTYDLTDPDERAQLCARVRGGPTGDLTLRAWSQSGERQTGRSRVNTGFIMVDSAQGRTALVHLEPGESATVVQANSTGPHAKPRRVQRSLALQRGNRTITVTESADVQRVCLEY